MGGGTVWRHSALDGGVIPARRLGSKHMNSDLDGDRSTHQKPGRRIDYVQNVLLLCRAINLDPFLVGKMTRGNTGDGTFKLRPEHLVTQQPDGHVQKKPVYWLTINANKMAASDAPRGIPTQQNKCLIQPDSPTRVARQPGRLGAWAVDKRRKNMTRKEPAAAGCVVSLSCA